MSPEPVLILFDAKILKTRWYCGDNTPLQVFLCPYMMKGTRKNYMWKTATSKAAEIALPQIIDSWIWKYVVLC